MTRGLISIGTNSTRALVAEFDGRPPHVLLRRSTGTRIGEGLKERGALAPEAMRRTLDAIRDHVEAVRRFTNDFGAIATSALRRAENRDAFADEVRAITGSPLETISGDEEARCSYAGAVSGIDADAAVRIGVADTGGGSTEYAAGTKAESERIVSCEIGAVRLTEAVPALSGAGPLPQAGDLARARSIAEKALAPVREFEPVERLVLVGGSATTTVALLNGSRDYFDYGELTRDALQQQIERLARLDLESRKTLAGMNPQRADILLSGMLVLDSLFGSTSQSRATVSANDLLLGFLIRHSAGTSSLANTDA